MQNVDEKYFWTEHARFKLRQYGLSESRIKRIIRYPARIEEGILDGAVACMQPAGGKKYSEIWAMYVVEKSSRGMHFRHARPLSAAASLSISTAFLPAGEKPSSRASKLSQMHTTGTFKVVGRVRIITAWRYPAKSPERDPIPREILKEVKNIIFGEI